MDDAQKVEDILGNLKQKEEKKKKIKSGRKGKRGEREVVALLNKRFEKILAKNSDWGQFSRSIGSGNRWGQKVVLGSKAKHTFSGDITCPDKFKWVVESKQGYDDIDLYSVVARGSHKEFDKFLQQVMDDAERSGRKPMLVWKRNYLPRLCFMRTDDVYEIPPTYLQYTYDGTIFLGFPFETVLEWPDKTFF